MEKQLINFFLFAFILCFIGVQSSTQYIDRGTTSGFIPYQLRDKVITTKNQETTTYSKWIEKGSYNNKNSKSAHTFSYSYSETNSRSFSLGAGVTKSVLSAEVNLSIGGELSWSKTDSFSGSAQVPANKVAHAFIRTKIVTTKFKHRIQKQKTDIKGTWQNNGSEVTTYSTVISKTPQIKIDILNN